jgi:hypothetical protein
LTFIISALIDNPTTGKLQSRRIAKVSSPKKPGERWQKDSPGCRSAASMSAKASMAFRPANAAFRHLDSDLFCPRPRIRINTASFEKLGPGRGDDRRDDPPRFSRF